MAIENFVTENVPEPQTADDLVADQIGDTLLSEEHLSYPYISYSIKSRIVFHSGKLPMAIASETGGCRSVSAHGQYTLRVVEWSVRRRGKLPILPSPEPVDSEEELVKAEIISDDVGAAEAIAVEYVFSGVYIYLIKTVKWLTSGFRLPTVPWTTVTRSNGTVSIVAINASQQQQPETTLRAASFQTGLF